MADPVFPTLQAPVDSSQFTVTFEDPAMREEMEGGYVITRARHRRTPRKTFRVVYRNMLNTDRSLLETFWNTVAGGSRIFDWQSPQDVTTYKVRFKEALTFTYVGKGTNQRWDCAVVLEQA